eukprot:s1610_g4.t2
MSQASDGAGERTETGVGSQLTTLVPTFDPAKDSLQIYQQKVELVLAAWPKSKITELVMRLILNCQGSAFAKLQLHQTELMENDEKSVRRLVELLGGHWGRIGLERQYEEAEAAIFNTQQVRDETNDSYLARSDIAWSKFLAQKVSMADLQAFVLLRGSTLSPEEKKRVILEADNSLEGKLSVKRVSEAIRILGATFFNEMTGLKSTAKQKVYSASTLIAEHDDEDEPVFHAQDEQLEDEFVETLLSEGDVDAALVADFESAAQDLLQEDPDLATAFSAYTEARRRLTEKFKNRGFWSTSKASFSSSKGKNFSAKGGQKGKAWTQRPRRSLQDRILNSYCRNCNRKGHWKAECPYKQSGGSSAGASTTPSSAPGSMPTTTVSVDQPEDIMPLEFLQLPLVGQETIDDTLPIFMSFCDEYDGKNGYQSSHSSLIHGESIQQPAVAKESLEHLTLEDLSSEVVTFGQKFNGSTFADTWQDQEWVQFMIARYQKSGKESHQRYMRFVELKIESLEKEQMVLPRASVANVSRLPAGKSKAMAKSIATASVISSLDGEGDWEIGDMEPERYNPVTMEIRPHMNEDVAALQQRMLNMEDALTRVIRHIETQSIQEQLVAENLDQ